MQKACHHQVILDPLYKFQNKECMKFKMRNSSQMTNIKND